MTREEIANQQLKIRKWRESEVGKLFERYDASSATAWIVDATSDSPTKLDQAWAQQRKDKAAFLDKVCEIAGIENPYAE